MVPKKVQLMVVAHGAACPSMGARVEDACEILHPGSCLEGAIKGAKCWQPGAGGIEEDHRDVCCQHP